MEKILEVKNVSKKYNTFKLDDFSFSVSKGKIVGFIGRNGAGKTTTLKGIMNLLKFDEGDVYFMGNNMKTYEKEAKQEIGFALSELNYYPNQPIKNMVDVISRFYPNFSMEKFKKLTQFFKLDTRKKLQELSSGMKVKYSLAIALSHDAKLLILDEPTSGLDPISRAEILDIFESLVKEGERSIIFSTHITSDLDKCADDILYIKEGKKIYEGAKKDFIEEHLLISGPISEFDLSVQKAAIAYKNNNGEFEALIKSSDKGILEGKSIVTKVPDLEEIMVYMERNKKHEELVL